MCNVYGNNDISIQTLSFIIVCVTYLQNIKISVPCFSFLINIIIDSDVKFFVSGLMSTNHDVVSALSVWMPAYFLPARFHKLQINEYNLWSELTRLLKFNCIPRKLETVMNTKPDGGYY